MKKLLFIIFIVTLFSCTKNKRLESLESQIQIQIEKSQNDTLFIAFESLDTDNFDHYLILTPYVQTLEDMESTHDLDLSNVSDGIQHYDHFNTVILLNDRKSIGYFNVPISYDILSSARTLHKSNEPLKIKGK